MEAGPAGEDAGTEGWSGWRAAAGMLVWFGLMSLSIWLLQGWLGRRSGLPPDLAWIVASLPGNVLGLLLSRRIMRTEPGTSPEQRRREAEKAERDRRSLRTWIILTLSLLLLGQAVSLLATSYDGPVLGLDWSALVMNGGFVMCGLTHLLSLDAGEGASPERVRFEQAAQREALRVGYAVAVVLGLVAAAVAVRLPLVAGNAWEAVLLASVLAAEVRMAMVPRWTARPA